MDEILHLLQEKEAVDCFFYIRMFFHCSFNVCPLMLISTTLSRST